jgi:hypothetical protein
MDVAEFQIDDLHALLSSRIVGLKFVLPKLKPESVIVVAELPGELNAVDAETTATSYVKPEAEVPEIPATTASTLCTPPDPDMLCMPQRIAVSDCHAVVAHFDTPT